MNSMYGKTIIKPVETDTIVKDNKDHFGKYISFNYNYIGSVIVVNRIYYTKKTIQFYHIMVMFSVVLKSCLCQNEL